MIGLQIQPKALYTLKLAPKKHTSIQSSLYLWFALCCSLSTAACLSTALWHQPLYWSVWCLSLLRFTIAWFALLLPLHKLTFHKQLIYHSWTELP